MGHIIDKQFDFCYGHRVWNQELKEGFAIDTCLACRHLHGHQGEIHIFLDDSGNEGELKNGMVTDFKHLGWFKKWLDDTLDHKFIMDINDPLLEHEVPLLWENGKWHEDRLKYDREYDYWIIYGKEYISKPSALKEKYEGMIFVDFVPTSENLCKWIFKIVERKMAEISVSVHSVTLNETPKSRAAYYG